MAASIALKVLPSLASVDSPSMKLSNTHVSAAASRPAARLPLAMARSTHARMPARVCARERVSGAESAENSGDGVLMTPSVTMQPLGWPRSHCILAERRSASSTACFGSSEVSQN